MKMFSFSSVYFWLPYIRKSSVHRCVDLDLGCQFYFIGQSVYFCANTVLFSFLFVVQLKIRDNDTSHSYLNILDCFIYPGIVVFPFKVENVLSRSVKDCVGILVGIALNVQIAFGRMNIFTMLILLIHEHGRSSNIFLSVFFLNT